MTIHRTVAWMTALLPILAGPVSAHSLEELGTQLSATEKYFQPVGLTTPDFALEDAAGRDVRMSDFRDKVVVLYFIYTTCGDVCPLHSVLIAQLQTMINQTPVKDRVAFVSITTDPQNDKGSVLTEYGESQGLDPVNWTFLTSGADQPEDTTRKIAKAYGLEFTETPDGAQMHGIVTHVIDRKGQLRGRFHSLRFDPVTLVTFVNALVNDVHRPGEQHEEANPIWSWLVSLFAVPEDQGEPQ